MTNLTNDFSTVDDCLPEPFIPRAKRFNYASLRVNISQSRLLDIATSLGLQIPVVCDSSLPSNADFRAVKTCVGLYAQKLSLTSVTLEDAQFLAAALSVSGTVDKSLSLTAALALVKHRFLFADDIKQLSQTDFHNIQYGKTKKTTK